MLTLDRIPVEVCDELDTQAVPLPFLARGDYVLLDSEIDDDEQDIPLLVDAGNAAPVLWRYAGVAEQDDEGNLHLVFDGGDDEVPIVIPADPQAKIRRVVPGQEARHTTWEII